MRARRKLDEAAYFLGVLRRFEKTGYMWKSTKRDAFHHNLGAFIVAWRSVVDVMLSDMAETYSLGFGPRDRITDTTFEAAAKALRSNDALRFLRWWRQQVRRLRKNPLYRRRDMIVHRGTPPATYLMTLPETFIDDMGLGENLDFVVLEPKSGPARLILARSGEVTPYYLHDRLRAIEEGRDERISEKRVTKGFKLTVHHELEDFSGRPITEVCEWALHEMRRLVDSAGKDFGAKQKERTKRPRAATLGS